MTNTPHWVKIPPTPEAIDVARRFDAAVNWIGILTKGGSLDEDSRLPALRMIGGDLGKTILNTPGAVLYVKQELPYRSSIALQWLAQHPAAISLDIPGDMPELLQRKRSVEMPWYILA